MRAILPVIGVMALLCAMDPCLAQSPPQTPPSPSGPGVTAPAESAEDDNPNVSAEDKRAVCRQEARAKGLRGPDLNDHVVICVQEARLSCLKEAVARRIRGPARREAMSKCMGREAAPKAR
jgi:hypothetical protein